MTADEDRIDTDGGPREAVRARLCAVTRTVRPVDEMIRFVAGPDGVIPDLRRRLPGRGVWVTATRAAVAEATKRGVFRRGLKADARVPADLPDLVERLMVRAALDALAIAHKAGLVAPGYVRTEQAIGKDNIVAVIHAADASADGARKLAAALARRHIGPAAPVATVRSFSSAQLDLALGRANVVHAALLAGRASETFLARWLELERFRMAEGGNGRTGEAEGSPATTTETLGME